MNRNLTTYVRAALAICVIVVTFDLTLSEPTELGQKSAGLSTVPAKNAVKRPAPVPSSGSIRATKPAGQSGETGGPARSIPTPQPSCPCGTTLAPGSGGMGEPGADRRGTPPTLTRSSRIPKEWEAIFVLVIGFYFSDRPMTQQYREHENDAAFSDAAFSQAVTELWSQLILGVLLILGTITLFVWPLDDHAYRDSVAGAWIAGVAIAVGFFFKSTGTKKLDEERLTYLRAFLALLMVAASVPMCFVRGGAIPLQWISLVFIVIAFYFKERAAEGRPRPAGEPQAG